ncbi:hypothetical protein HDV00_001469 [Rhizophlyctis rosea]|nr:hypothetical protein HDV00_001469 [Rhizophlyctis rosea]
MTSHPKTAIKNVRVFTGTDLSPPTTIVIENGLITNTDPSTATHTINGTNHVLLPGLIDCHVHIDNPSHLHSFLKHGVTTALDMGNPNLPLMSSLKSTAAREGLPDIKAAGMPATVPGSKHSHLFSFPADKLLTGPDEAAEFVNSNVEGGCDYIKIITDIPGPSQEVVDAVVREARRRGKMTIAHAVTDATYCMAIEAGVDVVTHVPMDKGLEEGTVKRLKEKGIICVPTLTVHSAMTGGMSTKEGAPSRSSVSAMYEAGVPILCGTDACADLNFPFVVRHGESLHEEFSLLCEAGVSNLDVVRGATCEAARVFGMEDRGKVEVGKRADLVLVEGNPLVDIRDTKKVRRVWCEVKKKEGAVGKEGNVKEEAGDDCKFHDPPIDHCIPCLKYRIRDFENAIKWYTHASRAAKKRVLDLDQKWSDIDYRQFQDFQRSLIAFRRSVNHFKRRLREVRWLEGKAGARALREKLCMFVPTVVRRFCPPFFGDQCIYKGRMDNPL